jgi:hypothetical protein
MIKFNIRNRFLFLLVSSLVVAAGSAGWAQIKGLPASDQLGAEDGNGNPTFVGGVTNGGPTAHSEW